MSSVALRVDALAAEAHLALRPDHRAQRAQRRRLAGAVGAEQGRDRALGHAEADAVQHARQAVAGVQVDDVEQHVGARRHGAAPR